MPLQFDTTYYLQENPDVLAAILAGQIESAEAHFNQFGVFEGRNPNAIFNTFEYLAANPDVLDAGVNAFQHYLNNGAYEGRAPSASFLPFAQFDFQTYLDANPDLIAAGIDTALEAYGHFVVFGQFEGRPGAPDTGLDGGQTFTLTDGSDIIQGQPGNLIGSKGTVDNSGDDIILASENSTGGAVSNTLGSGDNINGGLGFDELKIIDSQDVNLIPTITSVERVSVQGLGTLGGTTVNMINAVGTTEVVNFRSTNTVGFTAVQNDVRMVLDNTTSDTSVAFADGAVTDGALDVEVINTTNGFDLTIDVNGADVTTLNVVGSGITDPDDINFFEVDVTSNNDTLTTLNVSGDSATDIHQLNNSLDDLTTINVTNTGYTYLHDLFTNNEDVTVVAADGGLEIELGAGDNTITTGAGEDVVTVGSGDNTISTGAGDDDVFLGADLNVDDAVEGGEGIDLISLEVNSAGFVTATDDVDAVVNGFEVLELTGDINNTTAVVVDLDNLDDISNVVLENTTEAGTAVAETQTLDIDATAAFGGQVTIEGIVIDLAANLSADDVASFIVTNFGADIVAAYNANNLGEVLETLTVINGDELFFQFAQASGDVPSVSFTQDTGPVSAGVTFGAVTTTTPGASTAEVQTLNITTAPTVNGTVIVTLDADAGGAINVPVFGGESTIETATRIATALNNLALVAAVVDPGTSTVRITYDASLGNEGPAAFNANGTNAAAPVTVTVTDGVAQAAEVQTVTVSGADANGGFVTVEGVVIQLDPLATADDVGFAIQAQAGAIIANNPALASVNYNTANDTLTFTFDTDAGDVAPVSIANSAGNFPVVIDLGDSSETAGVDGSLDSSLTIDNMATGGSVTLSGDNDGQTTVNLIADTAADVLNVAVDSTDVGSGEFTFTGVETLAFTTSQDVQVSLDVDGADATSITVTGSGGVAFQQDFAELTTFDASALAAANSATVTNDVFVTTVTVDDATFTGGGGNDILQTGAGNDTISGGLGDDTLIGNAGADTIGGGEGDDSITGGDGADTLTGGAGDDVFVYQASTDSFGANFDTISDFVTGSDTIDLSAVAFTAGLFGVNYVGETNSLASANSALFTAGATGELRAVFDTSSNQLYADVNDNGSIDGGDMIIQLTGVTVLDQADFI